MKDKLISYWNQNWCGIILISFIIIFFGKIIHNGYLYSDYITQFKKVCKDSGGIVFIPETGSGWPKPLCVNPEFFIETKEL